MTRDHIGFSLFLVFLLIAPKIPIHIAGGSERSSISLGFVGFIIWFLLCPNYLLRFPKNKLPLPLIILVFFAFYVFLVSLMSANLISLIYSVQFLFYIVACSLFFKKYFLKAKSCDSIEVALRIFFVVMLIYALGVLISVFTGPIYPWQTIYTLRPWGGMWIRQGVGFSEAQNMAAEILLIFAVAAIYLYQGNSIKKTILIILSLAALFSTLCRSPIIAFLVAIVALLVLDFGYYLLLASKIKKWALVDTSYLLIGILIFTIIGFSALIVNEQLFSAIFSGFNLGRDGLVKADLAKRITIWIGGLLNWSSLNSVTAIIFGRGFRSSMGIVSETGAWATSHNLFITILAEFGIIGLLIFILFFITSLLEFCSVLIKKNNDVANSAARFGFVSVFAIMIHNLAGEFLYSPVLISMIILVVMLSYNMISERENKT